MSICLSKSVQWWSIPTQKSGSNKSCFCLFAKSALHISKCFRWRKHKVILLIIVWETKLSGLKQSSFNILQFLWAWHWGIAHLSVFDSRSYTITTLLTRTNAISRFVWAMDLLPISARWLLAGLKYPLAVGWKTQFHIEWMLHKHAKAYILAQGCLLHRKLWPSAQNPPALN